MIHFMYSFTHTYTVHITISILRMIEFCMNVCHLISLFTSVYLKMFTLMDS